MPRTAKANHPKLPDTVQDWNEDNPGFRTNVACNRTGTGRNVALCRNSRVIEIRTGLSAKKAADEKADKALHQVQ